MPVKPPNALFSNLNNNKFRNNTNRRMYRTLFWEYASTENKSYVLYTLKDFDYEVTIDGEKKVLPSLYLRYMEEDDLTEYEFANKYMDSYEHWTILSSQDWFRPHIERWRKELDLKIKSKALKKIRAVADGNSPNSFQANKILIERSWEQKNPSLVRIVPSKVGRPSNEDISNEIKKRADEETDILEDYERIND